MITTTETASKPADASDAGLVTRRRARAQSKAEFDGIKDDARRSISVRVNTSDYGRLKSAARRLGVRESDVFRHVLRTGLVRLLRVLDLAVEPAERYRLLVNIAADFSEDFGMSVRDCIATLGANGALDLDAADVELISMAVAHPIQAGLLLDGLAAPASTPSSLSHRLGAYLAAKHSA